MNDYENELCSTDGKVAKLTYSNSIDSDRRSALPGGGEEINPSKPWRDIIRRKVIDVKSDNENIYRE